jgi:hypothetical protein
MFGADGRRTKRDLKPYQRSTSPWVTMAGTKAGIKTIPRRGYRSEGSIRDKARQFHLLRPYGNHPSLFYEEPAGDPSNLMDGITDDILTDLSRYAELFIIAPFQLAFATWIHVGGIARELRCNISSAVKRRTKNAQRHRQLSCHGRRNNP